MRVLAIFAIAGGLSGVAATVMLFALTDNLFVWLLLGYRGCYGSLDCDLDHKGQIGADFEARTLYSTRS
jgi:hypothetical protein